MPKSRTRKNRKRWIRGPAKTPRRRLPLWGAVVAVSVLITIISGYLTIVGYWMPRLSVQPLQSMNPRDPLSAEFSVTNQGSMALNEVGVGFRFNNFRVRRADSGEEGDEFVPVTGMFDSIPPMKSATVKVPFSFPEEEDVDIWVTVHYRPAWYPFNREDAFRFVTKVDKDGKIHWFPRPDTLPPDQETP